MTNKCVCNIFITIIERLGYIKSKIVFGCASLKVFECVGEKRLCLIRPFK